jgi:O-antigen/teichoic acid export membrane protein
MLGQGSVQLLTAMLGFWLVRWLSVESYAQYGLVFSIQTTMGIFIDMGLAGSIVALVGVRTDEPDVIAKYVRATLFLRSRLLLVVTSVGSLVFWSATNGRGWSTASRVILLMSLTISVTVQALSSVYTGPLLIQRNFRRVYEGQLLSATIRLGLVAILHTIRRLSAEAAVVINTAGLALTGLSYRAAYTSSFGKVSHVEQSEARREILRYIAPSIPGTIFFAIQGQLTVFLIAYLGKSNQSIAEVGALGRLGQLFLFLSLFNSTLIVPYIARLHASKLICSYLSVAAAAMAFATLVFISAQAAPEVFLFLVGKNYSHLIRELPWSIGVGCISYVAGVLWSMNNARKFIYWWATVLQIFVVVVAQALAVALTDISTTFGVIKLSLVTAVLNLCVDAVVGIFGLRPLLAVHPRLAWSSGVNPR